MAKDLDLPLKVIGVPTVREKDGLALSSRNVYLSAAERSVAPMLYRVLKASADAHQDTASRSRRVLDEGRVEIERAGFALDYLEARHALTPGAGHVAQGRADPAPGRGARSARRG